MKIYVVQGFVNEYPEYMEWTICAFQNEEKAKEFVEKCTLEYERIQSQMEEIDGKEGMYEFYVEDKKLLPHAYDPDFIDGSPKTEYKYFELQLL